MAYLEPESIHIIPVHPSTIGCEVQRLVVEKHVFPSLKSCHKRIVFLFSHGTGFHKETLHPFIFYFIQQLRDQPQFDNVQIDVVTWDGRTHGDSARLNEGTFSSKYTWYDHALDTKQVIDELELRSKYDGLYGVAHSLGASAMIICEYFHPKTFDGFCAIEPVLTTFLFARHMLDSLPTAKSASRRDTWQTREEIAPDLKKRAFWRAFDPDVMDLYVKYGMYETKEGTVKLKCPRDQESHLTYSDVTAPYLTYLALSNIASPMLLVLVTRTQFSALFDPETLKARSAKRTTVSVVEGSHMIVNENPALIAREISGYFIQLLTQSNEMLSKL